MCDPATLDVYGHLFPDRLDEVSDKIDERRSMLLAKAKYGTVDAEREALKAKLAEARSMSS